MKSISFGSSKGSVADFVVDEVTRNKKVIIWPNRQCKNAVNNSGYMCRAKVVILQ